MIYDMFENLELYCKPGNKLHRAITFAQNFDPAQPDGRYEVEGNEIFAMVATYETEPAEERKFECHRNYLDVQVLLAGHERQDVAFVEFLEPLDEYDLKRDLMFIETPKEFSSIITRPGRFSIFYPHDIHRPNCQINKPETVRKIVVKVRL